MKKDMLIDNTNDKEASVEEKAIWKILDDYKLPTMLLPSCADEIIELVNELFIQRISVSFTKNEVINILQKRADSEFNKFHVFEKSEILKAIDIITRLMPPSSFPDW